MKLIHKYFILKLEIKATMCKGGYLDFSHLTQLECKYITEIYMKKHYKSSLTKNHKIKQKIFLMVFP